MIVQDSYIRSVGWHVRVYHAVSHVYADEILDELIAIGCQGEDLKNASNKIWGAVPNTGYTYSSPQLRETIMIILPTTCGEEYWNSFDHEKNHLLQHIALTTGVDPYGEQISYISGEFLRDAYRCAKELLCDCCRNRFKKLY